MTDKSTHILILGGGYAGVMAALRLAHRTRGLQRRITLINGAAHFVERCRLHEQATGTQLAERPLVQMLRGTDVRFRQGWVTALDPVAQTVTVRTVHEDEQVPYDLLINALGSRIQQSHVPGVDLFAYLPEPSGTRGAAALHAKLSALGANPFRAVVVGGGATGIETATQLKAAHPRSTVQIITQGKLGAFKNEAVRQHFLDALRTQQIVIREDARVLAVEADGVLLATGKVAAEVVIWAGGFVASPLARVAGVRVNSHNQILVDPYLRSISHPTLYAVGDAAQPIEEPGVPYRMSLMTALVSGAQAAENVAALLRGKAPQPLSFVWYGQGIALGPQDAVGFPTYPADQARGLILRGKLAVWVRNFFVWYLVVALELERRFPGSFYWNGKGRYSAQKRRQAEQTGRAARA